MVFFINYLDASHFLFLLSTSEAPFSARLAKIPQRDRYRFILQEVVEITK